VLGAYGSQPITAGAPLAPPPGGMGGPQGDRTSLLRVCVCVQRGPWVGRNCRGSRDRTREINPFPSAEPCTPSTKGAPKPPNLSHVTISSHGDQPQSRDQLESSDQPQSRDHSISFREARVIPYMTSRAVIWLYGSIIALSDQRSLVGQGRVPHQGARSLQGYNRL